MDPKLLLILDIDEVLVHATESNTLLAYDFETPWYKVVKRPYVDEFISAVSTWFDLAVWTAAGADYTRLVLEHLLIDSDSLRFIWCRERCTRQPNYDPQDEYWIKDLKKVKRRGYDLDRVLVIEDDPRSMRRNYGNLIAVTPFYGDPLDRELLNLTRYLKCISTKNDVRTIEKRHWQSQYR